jgi:hypothetical protein
MKREFRTLFALSLMTVSAAALPAIAAEIETLRVTVPFAFTAGTASLPAGDYMVSQQFDSRILTIGGKGGMATMVTVVHEPGRDMPVGQTTLSNLTFERTSKGNTLTVVQMSGRPCIILNRGK